MERLNLIQDDWGTDDIIGEHQIQNPLYLDGYISGLRNIFESAAERRERIEENKNKIISNDRSNIFTFVGRRGSGKTTAMEEFCRILRSLENEDEKEWWIKKVFEKMSAQGIADQSNDIVNCLLKKKFQFHILEPIDASLFGEKEDLFEQIMVNIYHKFQSIITENASYCKDGYEMGKIMQCFADIMKRYHETGETHQDVRTESSLVSMMQFLSTSQMIQKDISELLNKLIEYSPKADDEYIVIPIDDLDLNLKNGYQMLEQLTKYFSGDKIIILLTVDYDQMRVVCEEHFAEKLQYNKTINPDQIWENHIRRLAKDFMVKMFHLSQRIYMPTDEKLIRRTLISEENENNRKVKEYLFNKIAKTMGIYYDIKGMKRHFMEPCSVRELVVYNDFLDSLNDCHLEKLIYPDSKIVDEENGENEIKLNNKKILKKYEKNYERFRQDIQIRLAQNSLSPMQREAFEKLCSVDMERRARYFVCSQRDGEEIVFTAIDHQIYSYGGLLEKIYEWGRKADSDCFQDRPYISCILASFTSEMVRDYLNYLFNTNEEKRKEKYKRRLLGFMGVGFGNKWTGEAFPKILGKKMETGGLEWRENLNLGYEENATIGAIKIEFDISILEKSRKFSKDIIKRWVKEQHIVETIEFLDMFFVGTDGNEFIAPEYGDLKIAEGKVDIKAQSNIPVNVDVMGFAVKSIDMEEEKKRLENNIVSIVLEILRQLNYKLLTDLQQQWIVDVVEQNSIFYGKSEEQMKKMAFPICELDLSYNIFKRLRRKFKNSKPMEFKDALRGYLREIKCLLDEEAKEYKNTDFPYSKIFSKNPYVEAVLEGKIPESVWKTVRDVIISVFVPKETDAEEDGNNKE